MLRHVSFIDFFHFCKIIYIFLFILISLVYYLFNLINANVATALNGVRVLFRSCFLPSQSSERCLCLMCIPRYNREKETKRKEDRLWGHDIKNLLLSTYYTQRKKGILISAAKLISSHFATARDGEKKENNDHIFDK